MVEVSHIASEDYIYTWNIGLVSDIYNIDIL